MGLIISVSGLRGMVPEELNPQIAYEYAAVFGTYLLQALKSGQRIKVCIGRDTRPTSPMLAYAAIAGLASVGTDVIDLGVVTTPTVGVMTRHLGCDGAVVITASHNPHPYNGIKLIDSNGMALASQKACKFQELYSRKIINTSHPLACGRITVCRQSDRIHIGKVLRLVDSELIKSKMYRVVLDPVNGAGGRPAKALLKALGCSVKVINGSPTGLFARRPEPVAENLKPLSEAVSDYHADIGFAQDPDGDRLAIVDADGRCLGEECTLALAVMCVLAENPGTVVTNLSTSRMIDDVAAAAGCKVIRTAVGEANVVSSMVEHNCIIGGEGNGGVIDTRVGLIRDSLVAIAWVLQLMARTALSIRQLADRIPSYAMVKRRFNVQTEAIEEVLIRLKKEFAGARLEETDGLRCDLGECWFHLRPSNTEPVMRLVAEAKNQAVLLACIQRVEAAIGQTVLDDSKALA